MLLTCKHVLRQKELSMLRKPEVVENPIERNVQATCDELKFAK